MSSGNGREGTSQGKRSAASSQSLSEVGSPMSSLAKKQRGEEGQGRSASTVDELTHSGEHINYQFSYEFFMYTQNHSNTSTLGNNLKALNIKYI